jgi:hypothetical protein
MDKWVMCKSAIDQDKLIYVNMGQVVCLMDKDHAVEVTYSGDDCSFLVAGKSFDILVAAGIIPNA